jgi:hypothetical protein
MPRPHRRGIFVRIKLHLSRSWRSLPAVSRKLLRIFVKLFLAALGTKVISLSVEIRLPGGIGRIYIHATNRIFFCCHSIHSFVGIIVFYQIDIVILSAAKISVPTIPFLGTRGTRGTVGQKRS